MMLHKMTISMLILLLLSGLVWAGGSSGQTALYRIDLRDHGSAVPLAEAGIDILGAIPNDHALAELSDQQMTELIRMGYRVDYVAASLKAFSELDETDDYYNYTTLTAQLQTWATENSDIAILYDLGTTVQGRTVWGMKISDNPLLEEDEIVCFFCGTHHGNEKISAEVPMYFLGYIFDNYGTNPDVTYWVENREIWVIPVVNPDGYANNSRYNANSVDINRNYSFHWGESASHYGPFPFSEVESQAIRDLNLAHHFTTSHSYHSYGEEILYPFAWAANHPSPDNSFYVEMAGAMAALNGYFPMLSGNLYPHGGEMNDYLYGEKGVMAVTSEVWGGPGYNPPVSGILAVCQENLPTDLYQLQRAEGAQITGFITDASTGDPLVAQHKVVQLWNPTEIYPRYSEPDFGRYRHLVVPGTYTLEVSKDGYVTQTIPGIVVVSGTPTVRNVELVWVGFPQVDIAMTPLNPPIVIPPAGGSFQYEVDLANNSGSPQTADVWINVTLPNGSTYGPLVLRSDMNMPAGFSAYRLMTQTVPAGAPAGTYTMNAYVGDYDLIEIWSEDHFDFSKTGVDGEVITYLPETEGFDLTGSQVLSPVLPGEFAVDIHPNPFNPATTLSFALPHAGVVKLSVFDLSGRLITRINEDWMDAGVREIRFDGSNLASGIYIYHLEAHQLTASGKMILMK